MNVMTESLSEARQRIEVSDQQRKQLLADISHELATPLTSIRGYTETLLEPQVPVSDEERATFLQNILEESKRMDLLIQDLFDLTRLESGTIEMEKVRLDWGDLCRNTLARFQSRFGKAGLTIQWAGSEEPAWVLADGRRLEQLLENLLINALRYVPSGGTVSVTVDPADDHYRLTVSDDGPGFPAEDLPHIFDRFYRADTARTSPGSGLGLAIVQEIARQHGGQVRAENRAPHGATISVELPAGN
jgi:signal transduction histidine kinase